MFSHRLLIATAVVALLFAGTCVLHAQPADNGQEGDFFSKLDTNQDGKIDRTEFKGSDEAFARLDKNGDGGIARDELAGQQGDMPGRRGGRAGRDIDPAARWQQMLQRLDADKDGKISAEEFQGPEQVLRLFDANNDGAITEEEAMQVGNGGGGRFGGGDAVDPEQRWNRIVENCDADRDGKISQAEWPGRPEGFARFDTDGDGFLVKDELIAAADPGRGEGRAQRQNPTQIIIRMMDSDGDGQVSKEEWVNFFGDTDVNEDGLMTQDELMAKLQEALRPPARPDPAEEPPAPAEGF